MKPKDVVCVSMTTWEGEYMKTIVQMMSQLAKNHRVLFVDYAFTWKDVVFAILGKSKAPVKRMFNFSPRLREITTREGHKLYHLTLPPIIPINWIKSKKWFNRLLGIQTVPVISSIKKAIKALHFDQPIMINAFHPVMGVALNGKLDVTSTIYYCYDEIRAAQWAGAHGGDYENKFLAVANQVFVTSQELYKNRRILHPAVTLIKNGVDFDLFHKGYNPQRRNTTPVVGYLGSIDDRLDYDFLDYLISNRPDLEFHFVGRITYPRGVKRLEKYPNVNFFGARKPDELPEFLSRFDVGIIPFVKNEFTRNIYPLKINEYLAAGVPVVSTDFSDLSDFQGVVSIAADPKQFNDAIEASRELNVATVLARVSIAKSNSWSARAEQVERFLATSPKNSHQHA